MVTILMLAVLVTVTGFSASNDAGTGDGLVPSAIDVMQSREEAVAQDLSLIADSRGWTIEEAQMYFRSEQAIGRVAVEVSARRPDIFVGSALSRDPTGAPTLYIKGPSDPFIDDLLEAEDVEIVVADKQPF
jgi:hypothetical protein